MAEVADVDNAPLGVRKFLQRRATDGEGLVAAMTEQIGEERYYTIKEAAIKLRRHWRTVWRWTVENKIEFHQPGPGLKILIPERVINQLKQN